jgi:hypothetical protein
LNVSFPIIADRINNFYPTRSDHDGGPRPDFVEIAPVTDNKKLGETQFSRMIQRPLPAIAYSAPSSVKPGVEHGYVLLNATWIIRANHSFFPDWHFHYIVLLNPKQLGLSPIPA